MLKKTSFITLFTLLSLSFFAQAQEVPPDWDFIILKSAHFDVIVNAKQQDLGQLYVLKLEQAYSFLNTLMTDKPERTVVVINDKTDVTNGYATQIPYPHIMAYPVLPGSQESLAEPGDWALEFLVHEYTHILTFAPTPGAIKPLRSIFGNIVSPNLLLPRWWKEGVAVHVESRIGGHGRLNSLYQDAAIRSLVASNEFRQFDVAQINELLPTWPEGMRAYLFGSIFWSQTTAEKQDQVIDTLFQRHGGRFPYIIETPAYEHLGNDYAHKYEDAMNETENRAKKQIKELQTTPFTETTKLPLSDTQYSFGPAISSDGHYLAVITVSEIDKRNVKILERPDNNSSFVNAKDLGSADSQEESHLQVPGQKDGPPAGTISRVNWFHQSNKIIYDKMDTTSRYEKYSDLHIYDLSTKKSEQISTALRAREPSVAPNDNEIAFVQLEGGRTHLSVMNLSNKVVTKLFSPPLQERISMPTYLDNEQIIFALRKEDGSENLWLVYKNSNQTPVKILTQYQQARLPKMTKKGLLFVASQNGVQNVYLASADLKTAKVITHTLSANYSSDLDPIKNDLYTTQMTSGGQALSMISADNWQQTPQNLPKVTGLFADRYQNKKVNLPAADNNFSKEEYSGGSYLWPQYWFPMLASSTTNNGIYVSAQTSGFDPLKYHQYSLSFDWDSGVNRGSFMGSYQYSHLPTWLLVQAAQINSYLVDNSNVITDSFASFSALPDVWRFEKDSALELGWRYLTTDTSTAKIKRTGPFVRYSYTDISRAGTQISPEEGKSAYLGATQYIDASSYYSHSQYIYGGNYYWSKFLPARHALSFRINGMYTPQDLSSVYGVSTVPYKAQQDSISPQYVMRGYPSGAFFGKTLGNANIEYRFPIKEIDSGIGTWPFFISRVHGAFIADGVSLHGYAYNQKTQLFDFTNTSKSYWTSGAELRFETTVGYVIPLNYIIGVYAPTDYPSGVSAALQLGGVF